MFNKKLTFLYVLKSNFTTTSVDEPIPFLADHVNLIYKEIPNPLAHPNLYEAFLRKHGITNPKEKSKFTFSPDTLFLDD